MADELNISTAYYFQIENGQRKLYFDTAIEIANILKIKPDKLFYEDFKSLYPKN